MLRASGFFYAQLAAPRHGITTPIQRLRNWQVTFLFTAFLRFSRVVEQLAFLGSRLAINSPKAVSPDKR